MLTLACANSRVVSTSAINCLERLVSKMTYYVSSGTLNQCDFRFDLFFSFTCSFSFPVIFSF